MCIRDRNEGSDGDVPRIYLGGKLSQSLPFLPQDDLFLLTLSLGLKEVVEAGRQLGPGRVLSLGAREYSADEADVMRCSQRMMSGFEVDYRVALQTAANELQDKSLAIILDLNVFAAESVPEVESSSAKGLSPKEFFSNLHILRPLRIDAFHLTGLPDSVEPKGRTLSLGAEILRDIILSWWT